MKHFKTIDPAQFGNVAVLMGGITAEREISIEGGSFVYRALLEEKIAAISITVAATDRIIDELRSQKIDRVFNMLHGPGGEDGQLQGLLSASHIPCTGSGVMASALSMDKIRSKMCWAGAGLHTPKWQVLNANTDFHQCLATLGLPLIVKPSLEGSSFGIRKVKNAEQLHEAYQFASSFCGEVYAEQWVDGKEYTASMLHGTPLPIIQLEASNDFYDTEAKYKSNTNKYYCPSNLGQEQTHQMQQLAIKACEVLGVTGWGRVDLFVDRQGTMQLLEINTVPGMTSHSLMPMAAKAHGLSFNQLVLQVLATSGSR